MKKNSVLIQINTRTWFNEIKNIFSDQSEPIQLDSLPDTVWNEFKEKGFNALYLLGVWKVDELTDEMIDKKNLKQEFNEVLPNWKREDTCGSPFSIKEYKINPMLGDQNTLKNLKKQLNDLGMDLILDFVPNHFGLQNNYVDIPDLFIEEKNFSNSTRDYEVIETSNGKKAIYHGKDPYFPSWEDTFQLNYTSQNTRNFMLEQLKKIAEVCNGVRCDMAMLLVNRIIQQTWGWKVSNDLETEFWNEAIKEVKEMFPEFTFIAEVYWDMEEELIHLGFDYCYDKKLYDTLRDQNIGTLEYILHKEPSSQEHTVRFLENHDEARAINVFKSEMMFIDAVITYTLPGIKFLHQKQIEGYHLKESLFLLKRSQEKENKELKKLFQTLFQILTMLSRETFNWTLGTNILKEDFDFGTNIYSWEWKNQKNNEKVVIIINFKNKGSLVKLNDKIKELTVYNIYSSIFHRNITKKEENDFVFELKPYGALFLKIV